VVAELLFVGTELLLGQILNTNAQFLSQRLAAAGIDVYRQTVVGDNPRRLAAAIREALDRADVLITSGGLGPTSDDLTKETVAAAMGLDLIEDAALLATVRRFFSERGRAMTANNAKQALVPRGGWAVPNPRGTAPGILLESQGKVVAMLPGPPHELVPMFDESILPRLASRMPGATATIVSRVLRLCGIGESEAETRLLDMIEGQGSVTIAPLASLGEVKLRLTTKAPTREAGLALIAPVESAIRARLGRCVYGVDDQTLAEATGSLLLSTGLTLAVAESCTGGLLGAQLTEVAGISAAFVGGIVAYANGLKTGLLGVSPDLLARCGAVSQEVAAAMAAGVRKATGADIGVAITGIAGPGGGTPDKPVGLVYVSLDATGLSEPVVEAHRFLGTRDMVRLRAARQAMVMLRHHLLDAREARGPR
jgi:nicotinamide-nucleotide amidase